jgi:hypothetical protein
LLTDRYKDKGRSVTGDGLACQRLSQDRVVRWDVLLSAFPHFLEPPLNTTLYIFLPLQFSERFIDQILFGFSLSFRLLNI